MLIVNCIRISNKINENAHFCLILQGNPNTIENEIFTDFPTLTRINTYNPIPAIIKFNIHAMIDGKLLVNKMIIAQTIIYATPAADGVGIVAFINNINGGTIPNKIIQIISILNNYLK